MRTIKYIITCLAVAISLFFIGLFYVEYVSSGMGFSKLVMRDNTLTTYEESFRKVQQTVSDIGLSSFFLEEMEVDGNTEIVIYADEEVKRILSGSHGLQEGVCRSVISGSYRVRFEQPETYFQRTFVNPTEYIVLITEKDITEELKSRGIEIPCMKSTSVNYAQFQSITFVILAIAVLLIAFLCLTDVLTRKKEMVVRRILGWNLRLYILCSYIKEAITLGSIILLTWLILRGIHLIHPSLEIPLLLCGIILSADGLFHILLLCFNVRKNLRRGVSRWLMAVHYTLRIASMAVTIAVVSFMFSQMTGLFPVLKMEGKYKCFDGYSIVKPMIFDSSTIRTYDPYDELEISQDLRALIPPSRVLEWRPDYVRVKEDDIGHEVIMANSKAEKLIAYYFPEYKDYRFDCQAYNYIFYRKTDIDEATLKNRYTEGFREQKTEIYLPYTETVDIQPIPTGTDFYLVEDLTQGLYKNPIVFFGDVESDVFALEHIGLDLSEEELQEYIRKVPKILTYTYSDIYGSYREFSAVYRMRLLLFSVLIIALLLLQFCVSFTIISLECELHALEFSVKKINGFPRCAIYDGMYTAEVAATVIGALCAFYYLGEQRMKLIIPTLACAFLLLIIDYIFMTGRLRKWEHENVPKILKGGCL